LHDFGFLDAFEGKGSPRKEEDGEPEVEGTDDRHISQKFGQNVASHDALGNGNSQKIDRNRKHRNDPPFLSIQVGELLHMPKCFYLLLPQ